jgi:hypothetical protein
VEGRGARGGGGGVLIAVAGYAAAGLVTAAIAALHAGRVVVPRIAGWTRLPTFAVYPELRQLVEPLTEAEKRSAALGWKRAEIRVGTVGDIVIGPPHRHLAPAIEQGSALALAELEADFMDEAPMDDDPLSHQRQIIEHDRGVMRHAYIGIDPWAGSTPSIATWSSRCRSTGTR